MITMNDTPSSSISLVAQSTRELQNDVLSIFLSATESGTEPAAVQEALRKKLSEALAVVRPLLKEGEVETETSGFSVQPQYKAKKAEIAGYVGSVNLTVKGTDTATIAGLAGVIDSMIVSGTANSLSRKLRSSVEKELTAEAIASFREKADAATIAFGFDAWGPGEISISVDRPYSPRGGSRMMLASVGSTMETPMEVESGKTEINATVQGSITLV